jgi:two-component system NtrC family sensor kinase
MIKKIFFQTLFLQLLCIIVNAQKLLPVYNIKTDTILTQTLPNDYWQMLPDKAGKWTINAVRKPPLTESFFRRDSVPAKIDTISHTYWFRYSVKNISGINANISLNSYADQDDFYVFDSSGTSKHFFTGQMVAMSKRDGLKISNTIPLTLLPGEQITVYDKAYVRVAGMPQPFSADINGTSKVIQRDYIQYLEESQQIFNFPDLQNVTVIGMAFLAMLLNMFVFFITKEKEYLWFSLLMLSICIARLVNVLGVYWYYNDPWLSVNIGYVNLAWGGISFSMVQFARHFFQVRKDYPRFSKFLFCIGCATLIYNTVCEFLDPAYLLNSSTHLNWHYVFFCFQFTVGCSLIAVLFLYFRKKSTVTKLVIVGGLPLICLWGIYAPISVFTWFFHEKFGTPVPLFMENFSFWVYEIVFIAWFVVLFSLILFMRFNNLRKENVQIALDKERLAKEKETERALLIEQQKTELEKQVAARTIELKQSLDELQSTQKQLIQQEKMASLGELTAGIAHEIQNPLNFVNNFSEVNKELLDELQTELKSGNVDEAIAISNDIKDNEEKINHHGKRADSIVKGMLQHTRASGGQKELTDINKLADEYLKLAYHGLRAKDKSFNAALMTNYDESVGSINIVSQDIARVLLNIYNNAFYAVNEKAKQQIANYEPAITVKTKKINDKVEIIIRDNGNGIPQKVFDKIFQPFFTTKPTGQGTGLGLSLSYDIIKAHGGEIKVYTKEGEFIEFIIII